MPRLEGEGGAHRRLCAWTATVHARRFGVADPGPSSTSTRERTSTGSASQGELDDDSDSSTFR